MTDIIAIGVCLFLLIFVLYVWSERVARRDGRKPHSEPRSIVILSVAVTLAVIAGHYYVWPEIIQRIQVFTLESRLSAVSYYGALKQHYPDEYQRLTAAWKTGDEEKIVQVANELADFVMERVPYASDAAAEKFNAALVRQLRELRHHPVRCYAHLFPVAHRKTIQPGDFSRETLELTNAAMDEVIRSSATGDYPPPTALEALPAMQSVLLSLQVKYGDDWQLLQETGGDMSVAEKAKVCEMMWDWYERILALPPGKNGKVLRYMLNL